MEAPLALAAVGATLVFAFAAGQLFRRHRVPDIPMLLLLGGLLGPWTGLVSVDGTAAAMPFIAALALVMVLFDGALEVRPDTLRSHGRAGLAMAFVAFTLTALSCAAVAHWLAGLPASASILLGMCLGGAGIVIILPMAKRLDVSPAGSTVLLMEAVVSDILVILAVTSTITVLLVGALDSAVAVSLVRALGVAGVVGVGAGWAWGRFVTRGMENTYGVTLAVLLLVYAGTEAVHGSGPLAVLLFGLMVGRAMRQAKTTVRVRRMLDAQLIDFHQEAMFFVRAFLFVGLGVITRWDLLVQPVFLAVGIVLTAVVAASRALAVVATQGGLGGWDRTAVALLFPRGLVTAAAALLPVAAGVPHTAVLAEYAAAVIVLTNLAAAVAVFVAVRSRPEGPPAGGVVKVDAT